MTARTRATPTPKETSDDKRSRILRAAMEIFREHGFAAATTLEIATRARVSKRELYALVGNKQEMLRACIDGRVQRLEVAADMPVPQNREALGDVLSSFGAKLLGELSEPSVVAVFRLAIAEAVNAPEVAQALESTGRERTRAALRAIITRARSVGLLDGRPAALAEQFASLLWGDLMLGLLLGVAQRPSAREAAERARNAAAVFLRLHPGGDDAATRGNGS